MNGERSRTRQWECEKTSDGIQTWPLAPNDNKLRDIYNLYIAKNSEETNTSIQPTTVTVDFLIERKASA